MNDAPSTLPPDDDATEFCDLDRDGQHLALCKFFERAGTGDALAEALAECVMHAKPERRDAVLTECDFDDECERAHEERMESGRELHEEWARDDARLCG